MTAPKPSALKLLHGTWRPDRANPAEPVPASIGADPPPWLPTRGPARGAWDRLSAELAAMRVLTPADAEALALGCMALAEYLAARRRPSVSWRRADAAWKRYAATLREFGLTPSSRTRVAAVPSGPSEAEAALAAWEAKPDASAPDPDPPKPKRRKRATASTPTSSTPGSASTQASKEANP